MSAAVAAVVLGGTFAKTLPPSNGNDDTSALNTILATGGYFRGRPGETYKLSSQLVQPSDTTLDMTGCQVVALAGLRSQLWVNKAAITPVASDEDAKCYVGSNVIDFYPGSGAAAQFAVGMTIVVDGGQFLGPGSSNPVPLVATVTKVNVDARNDGTTPAVPNTITIDRPAKATTNYWAIRGYDRDKNVTVIGGKWVRGSNGFDGLAIRGNSLMARHVDNLRIDVDEFFSETNTAHYPISAADFTNGWFRIKKVNSGRDGIHLMGPFKNAHVESIAGYCADDILSLTACDYAGGLTDSAGDCDGLTWGRVHGETHQQLVKILAGANCRVTNVKGGLVTGVADHYPAWVGEDTGNLGTVGGTYGDIDLGTIAGTSSAPGTYSQLFLAAPDADAIKARLVYAASTGYAVTTGRGGTGGATGGNASTAVIKHLDLDLDVTGPARLLNMAVSQVTALEVTLAGRYAQVSGSSSALTLAGRIATLRTRAALTLTAALATGLARLVGDAPVDVSTLTPADGDTAVNSNAALGCGVGRVVYSTAAAKWKHLYSGATT